MDHLGAHAVEWIGRGNRLCVVQALAGRRAIVDLVIHLQLVAVFFVIHLHPLMPAFRRLDTIIVWSGDVLRSLTAFLPVAALSIRLCLRFMAFRRLGMVSVRSGDVRKTLAMGGVVVALAHVDVVGIQ